MTYIPDWSELPTSYDTPRRKRHMPVVDEDLDEMYTEDDE